MTRLIDADALINNIEGHITEHEEMMRDSEEYPENYPEDYKTRVLNLIAGLITTKVEVDCAPAIDVDPVVRCKDCDRGFGSPVCPIQSKGWTINKDTFFCAWGERSKP